MRILLIDDSEPGRQWLIHFIRRKDGVIDTTSSLDDLEIALSAETYDVLLVDLELGLDNVTAAIRSVRRRWPKLRLLVFATAQRLNDVARALDSGADDFILKPFAPEELHIRLTVLASSPRDRSTKSIECGAVRFDLTTRQVWTNGQPMQLTPRERSVLHVLVSHCGSIVSKAFIASRIFSLDEQTDADTIEVYVHRLRRKLANSETTIKTVRGLGYVLEAHKA